MGKSLIFWKMNTHFLKKAEEIFNIILKPININKLLCKTTSQCKCKIKKKENHQNNFFFLDSVNCSPSNNWTPSKAILKRSASQSTYSLTLSSSSAVLSTAFPKMESGKDVCTRELVRSCTWGTTAIGEKLLLKT